MIEVNTTIRRWGNSLGIVVPLSKAKSENIEEGEKKVALLKKKKKNVLRETFGTLKFKKSTEQMMREIDRELYND